ncbi:MAG: hypothetical protein AABX54_00350 [Nanoarchaeota archaeon]
MTKIKIRGLKMKEKERKKLFRILKIILLFLLTIIGIGIIVFKRYGILL